MSHFRPCTSYLDKITNVLILWGYGSSFVIAGQSKKEEVRGGLWEREGWKCQGYEDREARERERERERREEEGEMARETLKEGGDIQIERRGI